jgi:hypothetical protein
MASQSNMPSTIHIERGEVFDGLSADKSRVIDLTKAENSSLVSCIKSEGHSTPSDWPDGDYRVEGQRLVPLEGGMSS